MLGIPFLARLRACLIALRPLTLRAGKGIYFKSFSLLFYLKAYPKIRPLLYGRIESRPLMT